MNASPGPLIPMGCARGTAPRSNRAPSWTSAPAKIRPRALPRQSNNRFSVTNCRSIRARPAPRVTRIASSEVRADMRASSRHVTFMEPVIKTSTTAPMTIMSCVRTSPTSSALSGATVAVSSRDSGPARCKIAVSSCAACAGEAVAFRRPITVRK